MDADFPDILTVATALAAACVMVVASVAAMIGAIAVPALRAPVVPARLFGYLSWQCFSHPAGAPEEHASSHNPKAVCHGSR